MTDERVQTEVDKEEEYDPFEDAGALTQKQANEYFDAGGIQCPYCRSTTINIADHDYSPGWMMCEMICRDCNHQWSENYKLVELIDEAGTGFEYREDEIPM